MVTVIIFYAGHGSVYSSHGLRTKKSERNRINLQEMEEILNSSSPLVDAIVRADRGQEDPDPTYAGSKVPSICDGELNAIFTVTRKVPILFLLQIVATQHFQEWNVEE